MRVRTTRQADIRFGEPNTSAPQKGVLYAGFELEVTPESDGEIFEGIGTWYKDLNGGFIWGGDVEVIGDHDEASGPPASASPERILRTPQELAVFMDWGSERLGIDTLWHGTMGEDVTVAVLDSGADENHPDLEGVIHSKRDVLMQTDDITDIDGHGTRSAWIIAGQGVGITGVAPGSSLMIVKLTTGELKEGIDWAVSNGADIVSMSMDLKDSDDAIQTRLTAARNRHGTLFVGAAGNDGALERSDSYPASYQHCISVGAMAKNLQERLSRSSRSPHLDIMAPGESIKSCVPGGTHSLESNTSSAAPFVSGVLALLVSYLRKSGSSLVSAVDIEEIVKDTASHPLNLEHEDQYGHGVIQPVRAMTVLKERIG